MKKLVAAAIGTVGLSLAVGTSYGQGSLYLNNYDSGMGIYQTNVSGHVAAVAGTMAMVLVGPSAGSLTPTFNTVVSGSPTDIGVVGSGDVNGNGPGTGSFFDFGSGYANTVAPSSTAFVEILTWSGASTYAAALQTLGAWTGVELFTQTVGNNPAPPTLPTPASLALPGIIVEVQTVPEPATLALGGLGAAALLLFRRRK